MDSSSTTPRETSGLTRRQVVRTGANVAWAVPLVTVATAAPALAVSGYQGHLQGSGMSVTCLANQKKIRIVVNPIKNTGKGTTGQVTVVVHIPKTASGPFSKPPVYGGKQGSGWTYLGMTTTSSGYDFTFISDSGLAPGQSTKPLSFQTKPQKMTTCPPGNISYVATAPNSDSTAGSAPIEDDGTGGSGY